jgi:hypothetical protein
MPITIRYASKTGYSRNCDEMASSPRPLQVFRRCCRKYTPKKIQKRLRRALIQINDRRLAGALQFMFYFMLQAFCDARADVPMANGMLGELPPSSLLPGTGNA